MHLLPIPQKCQRGGGVCRLPYQGSIMADKGLYHPAKLLQQDIATYAGMNYGISRGSASLSLIKLRMEEGLTEEGYKLNITESEVCIVGSTYRGVLYGVQTLRQILRQEGSLLPLLGIEDSPVYPNRGFYHDVTRGRIPTLESMKKMADTLSFYKMNQLQLYIEHSYMFSELSEMWRDDTPLTAEDILELDAYCAELGIELVPSLSSFGHLYKLLCTKGYRHLCELEGADASPFSFEGRMQHHTLNVTMEESYELVIRCIEEFMPLFTSVQFNIGADETFDLGKGKSREYAQKVGVDRMYIEFVKRLCEYLVNQGRRPMFWGDVICGFPELIKELPPETICLNWGYAWDQKEDQVIALSKAGATQYVCPGVGGWNQFINLMESAYSNITKMCDYGFRNKAIGMLNTDWGDFGHINHPLFGVPGIIYGAAFSWNRADISFEAINRAVSVLEYGDTSEACMEAITRMSKRTTYSWYSAVIFQESYEQGNTERALRALERNKEQLLKTAEYNGLLAEDELALQACVKHMAVDSRELMGAYLIASDGIRLFNKIGESLLKVCINKESAPLGMGELAAELEHWFYQYRMLWHSVSRESELYRITHVICWYADFLRDMERAL